MLGAIALAAVAGGLYWRIDDWGRDLQQNSASTADDATDPALRPLHVSENPDRTLELIRAAASGLPRWQLVDSAPGTGPRELHFVRSTPLFGFQDDIQVRVAEQGAGTTIHATSKSRVGRGDLGQNPRNLKELLSAIRQQADLARGQPH